MKLELTGKAMKCIDSDGNPYLEYETRHKENSKCGNCKSYPRRNGSRYCTNCSIGYKMKLVQNRRLKNKISEQKLISAEE